MYYDYFREKKNAFKSCSVHILPCDDFTSAFAYLTNYEEEEEEEEDTSYAILTTLVVGCYRTFQLLLS